MLFLESKGEIGGQFRQSQNLKNVGGKDSFGVITNSNARYSKEFKYGFSHKNETDDNLKEVGKALYPEKFTMTTQEDYEEPHSR